MQQNFEPAVILPAHEREKESPNGVAAERLQAISKNDEIHWVALEPPLITWQHIDNLTQILLLSSRLFLYCTSELLSDLCTFPFNVTYEPKRLEKKTH